MTPPAFIPSRVLAVAAVAAAIVATSPAHAGEENLSGLVIRVTDGDTVTMLDTDKQSFKVRLASIDAPETGHSADRVGQPYSDHAKRFLAQLVHQKQVQARCFETDKDGRKVCALSVAGVNVSSELVRNGWAWANMSAKGRYLRDRGLLDLQARALQARAGLWAGANPVPPWEWRRRCWVQHDCSQ